jgi:putative tricarboxylic transport membrane protein
MWVVGMLMAKQVVKVLRIPVQLFMPIIGILCIIGSYSLGMNIWNLYLMLPVGIISYFLIEMGYPIAPLVIGVILGPMADENLRRALMVSQGSFLPVFTRPVSLVLFLVIVWTVVSQFQIYRNFKNKLMDVIFRRKTCQPEFVADPPKED